MNGRKNMNCLNNVTAYWGKIWAILLSLNEMVIEISSMFLHGNVLGASNNKLKKTFKSNIVFSFGVI